MAAIAQGRVYHKWEENDKVNKYNEDSFCDECAGFIISYT